MNCCPCDQEKNTGSGQNFLDQGLARCRAQVASTVKYLARPRLFNWITVLLITIWMGIVAVVAETSQPGTRESVSMQSLIESLSR